MIDNFQLYCADGWMQGFWCSIKLFCGKGHASGTETVRPPTQKHKHKQKD